VRTSRFIPVFTAVVALSILTSGIAQAQDSTPQFEEAACPSFVEAIGLRVSCGYLIVPEDRSRPGGPDIRLLAAIFHSTSKTPAPDPVIYLVGGPGASSIRDAPDLMQIFKPYLQDRDFILFDQRGTGMAEPSLDCPEYTEAIRANFDDAAPSQDLNAILFGCRQRLVDAGVNLAAYTSAENAADLDALRRALGYEQWNLYGISYGTRLALTAVRDYPDGIRAVILDSTYPPQADLYTELPANVSRALDTLFDACAADANCAANYPNLNAVFFEAIAALNRNPAIIQVTYRAGDQATYDMRVSGSTFIDILFDSLYRTEVIPDLPRLIYAARDGDYHLLREPLERYILSSEDINEAMYYSVQCSEEVPFSREALQNTPAGPTSIPIRAVFGSRAANILALCDGWHDAASDPVENEPVQSDIPVLVLAGEYDPVTPPTWGALAAETLSSSYFFTIPGYGHGVTRAGECPLSIAVDFLNHPTAPPNTTCIETLEGPLFVAR
jgi:pimeloyl-ACP methyl ester carboxylesterase